MRVSRPWAKCRRGRSAARWRRCSSLRARRRTRLPPCWMTTSCCTWCAWCPGLPWRWPCNAWPRPSRVCSRRLHCTCARRRSPPPAARPARPRPPPSAAVADVEARAQVVALKKVPQKPRHDKPIRIPIPHPIHAAEGAEVCLFVKDHKGEGHKAAKSKVRQERVAGVAKVVGLSKLRTKYEGHEAKRQLCSSYDLFAADERILPVLPKLLGELQARLGRCPARSAAACHPRCHRTSSALEPMCLAAALAAGKTFFKKKKQPVPVRLTGKDWAAQIRRACEATYLFWSGVSVQVALPGARVEIIAAVNRRVAPTRSHASRRWPCRRQQLDDQAGAVIAERAAVRGERTGGHCSGSRQSATQVGGGAGEIAWTRVARRLGLWHPSDGCRCCPCSPATSGAVPEDGRKRGAASLPGAAGCAEQD